MRQRKMGNRVNTEIVLKPYIIPEDMVVIIDTRETNPLWLPKPPKGLTLMRGTLGTGDYSLRGLDDKLTIERKADDIYSFLTSEREQTKVKLARMQEYEFRALVIEISEYELLYSPKFFTKISPEVIRQSLISFEIRYGLHVYYGSHADCERKVLDWMIYFWKFKKGV